MRVQRYFRNSRNFLLTASSRRAIVTSSTAHSVDTVSGNRAGHLTKASLVKPSFLETAADFLGLALALTLILILL